MVSFLGLLLLPLTLIAGQLSYDFYNQTCPNLDGILWNVTQQKNNEIPTAAAATVRLFFHDCFVEGCDGSILISSTPDNLAERDATINQNIAGDSFDAVIRAKKAVEKACPGVVSCADVLAIITRDFVVWRGGPYYPVLKGRRDGLVSKASRVGLNIPDASLGIEQLVELFSEKGLEVKDLMIPLAGAHTFGFAHCNQFQSRLYNFSSENATDPSLNPDYANDLKQDCPQVGANPDLVEPFDASSPFQFDNTYYQLVQQNMALINSDKALLDSEPTRALVGTFANSTDTFFRSFTESMQKLGSLGVKTGSEGEIRVDCTRFNTPSNTTTGTGNGAF